MNRPGMPPRILARMLGWAASRLGTPDLPDDAAELFADRVRRDGVRAARRWYRRQVVATLVRALLFGGRCEGRRGRGTGWLGGMSLDFRLGFRMLVKYPGLTVVGGLAMAFAISMGAAGFEVVTRLFYPKLPLEEGDRIVAIRNLDGATGNDQNPRLLDFARWRESMKSVEHLGAFRTQDRNLIAADGGTALVRVAEITASAFPMARVAPLVGRPLVREDERPGAAPVAVVGQEVWRRHFASAPDIVGRSIRLGRTVHTVVGVMPGSFEFPIERGLWVPLRAAVADDPEGLGPEVHVFGRLAEGVTVPQAQAELAAIGLRASGSGRQAQEQLRPRVLPYARSIMNLSALDPRILLAVHLFLVLLVILVCGNVALLLFARAATRETEIVTRSALGASRGRIVGQLFAEALVLAIVAAGIGLIAADLAVRWRFGIYTAMGAEGEPFWQRSGLAPATVSYAVALALLAATVAGCVPGLKVTRGLEARLRRATPGGGGFRFGGGWTVIVVTQVAAMIAFPPIAFFLRGQAEEIRSVESGFAADEFLLVRLGLDPETLTGAAASGEEHIARAEATYRALERRLEAEPAVAGVTFSDGMPLMNRAVQAIEHDSPGAPADSIGRARYAKTAAVAPDYLDLLNAPILAGRGFRAADLETDARVAIVNQSFVDRVLDGRNPIGQRIRYVPTREPGEPYDDSEPWYEIIGLVRDIGRPVGYQHGSRSGIYHPLAPGSATATHMAVHVRGEPESFVPRLRSLAAAVDPTLRLHDAVPLDDLGREDLYLVRLQFWLVTVVSAGAMLLSLAGIYSVLSFTVSRRTREMGVRLALGGGAWHVAVTMIRRPLAQVGIGVLVGTVLTLFLVNAVNGFSASGSARVAAYIALMIGVCTLASLVPVRRALGIEPTEALKTDG